MKRNDLQHALDLRRADLDPELLACALAVQYIRRLIAPVGNGAHLLQEKIALSPQQLDAFLVCAGETAHMTRHFEQEWRQWHQVMPQMQAAGERGKALFQEDLVRATSHPEEMEYLSQIDFVIDCYAAVVARKVSPHDQMLQAWITTGSILAWRQHFLAEEDVSLPCGCVSKYVS